MRKRYHYSGNVTDVMQELIDDAKSTLNESKALGKLASKALIVMWFALLGIVIEDIVHFGVFPWHFWAIWIVFWASCIDSIGLNVQRTRLLKLHDAMMEAFDQLKSIPAIGEPNISLSIDKQTYRERFRAWRKGRNG